MAHRPLVRLAWASLLGATIVPSAAVADPFPIPPQRPCAAPAAGSQTNSRLVDEIAAAERALDDRQPNVWPKLAQLAQYACVLGARAAVEPLLLRCLRECADDRDRYVTHIVYASLLEGSGDLLGAETQYSAAIASRADAADAVTAYYNYALLLDRSGRPQDALNLLNRLPQDPRTTSAVMPLKRWVMGELGVDTKDLLARMPRAPVGGPTDIPLSAIPIEDNPLAQSPFAQRIEVSSDVWVEPRSDATSGERAHLYYRRASFSDPSTFERKFQIKKGERFDVVADLGESGCRILFRANRYDLDDCPWRSTPASETGRLFRVVGTVHSPPSVVPTFRPPLPIGERPETEQAPEWAAWAELYRSLAAFERRGAPAEAQEVLAKAAELTVSEADAVEKAGEEYLRQVAGIDDELRGEIAARFAVPDSAPAPPGGAEVFLSPSPTAVPPLVLNLPPGTTLAETLTADGTIDRINTQKEALLRAHVSDLVRVIGARKATQLERYVRENVAPGVRVVTRGGPPAPPGSVPNRGPPQDR